MATRTLLHPTRVGRPAVAAAALTLALVMAGCSSSGTTVTGSAVTTPSVAASLPGASAASTPAVQSPAASSSSPAPVVSASSSGSASGSASSGSAGGAAATALMTKLLTAAEVGGGFTEATYDSQDTTSPCDPKGTPGVDEQVPPSIKVGRLFVLNSLHAQFEEDLQAYSNAATAAKALAALKSGLKCSTGNLYADDGSSIKVNISAPTAIPVDGPVQGGSAWSVTGGTIEGFAIVVEYGDTHLALLTLFAPTGTPDSKLPDVQTVIADAVQKFLS